MATPKKALAGIVTIPHEVALPMNIKFMYADKIKKQINGESALRVYGRIEAMDFRKPGRRICPNLNW
jgi:hypothetical protein